MGRTIVSLTFLAVIALVWIWDSVAGLRMRPDDTVSRTVLEWSRQWPLIPLATGILIGHLFWPQN